MIKYRRQLPVPQSRAGTAEATALPSVDYAAPSLPPVDGVVKLQPLASRLAIAAAAIVPQPAKVIYEAEEPEPAEEEPDEPAARRSRIVTLVTPWSEEPDGSGEEEEEAAEEELYEDETDLDVGLALDEVFEGEQEDSAPTGDLEAAPSPAGPASRTPKVLVVDRSGELAQSIERVAGSLSPAPEVVKLTRPMELVETAEAEDPDVVVVGPEEMTPTGLKRVAQVHKAQPRIVILLSDNDRAWSASQIAATGASDFLPVSPSRPKLKSKLGNALGTAAQLRLESIVVTERIVVHEPAPVQPTAPTAPQTLARVFTVASPTGGSGKTTVATNFAAYLARVPGRKVLMVDLDLQFGNLGPALHLHPNRSIGDLLEDAADLEEMVVEHAAGFRVLCAPVDPLQAESIGPDQVSEVLDAARHHYDFVVVDTPPVLNETCLAAFDRSEKVIVLANLDVPSLKNMRRYLETIQNLGVSEDQPVLVVNRSDSGIGLELKGVTQLFRQGFLAVLPSAKDVPWSTNMGNPILRANPKAEISKQLSEAFAQLVTAPGEEPPMLNQEKASRKAGLLGRKKGRS